MAGINTTSGGLNTTGGSQGGGGGQSEGGAVKYNRAQQLSAAEKLQARTNILAAIKEGEEPNLVAGDIIPKNTEPFVVNGLYNIRTAGGDNDLKSGPSLFQVIRGYFDENCNPFYADTYVSTGQNLVDPDQYLTINDHKGFYFPIAQGKWGSYGTTQENNGYVVVADTQYNVYFKATKPTAGRYGTELVPVTYNGKNYYVTTGHGWLTILMPNDTVPACHVAWSNGKDSEAGVFRNHTKDIETCMRWFHKWGMGGAYDANSAEFDEINLTLRRCYRRWGSVKLATPQWTMTEEQSGEGEQETTNYIFTATIAAMKENSLWRTKYQGVEVDGNTLTVRSTTIDSVEDLLEDFGSLDFFYVKAVPDETTFAQLGVDLDDDSMANDYGLQYFLNAGEIAEVPAYVTEAFAQSGKDPLYNNVAYSKMLAEVVATAFGLMNRRMLALERKKDLVCENLVVKRRASIEGWREVDAAPSSSNAKGSKGDYFIASDYIYICVATNTWKRAALSTF